MENQFTVNKSGKYYNVEYIGYEPHSQKFDIYYWNNAFFNTKNEVIEFIEVVDKFEKAMIIRLKELNLNHNPKKIIRFYMKMLPNILVGIDVRAKLPFDEKVDLFITWFDNRYKEADEFCKTIYETVVEYNTVESDNWRTYEDYEQKRNVFELPYGDLKEHFGLSTFDQLINSITDVDIKYRLYNAKMDSYGIKI